MGKKGRKESPPSPAGYLGVPAARESSSPAAGLGSCRRGEQDEPRAAFSAEGAAGLTSEVATSRPGPARPRRGSPGHSGSARCSIPLLPSLSPPRQPAVPLRCGTRALLSGDKHPSFLPSPFGCRKPPRCRRKGKAGKEGAGVKKSPPAGELLAVSPRCAPGWKGPVPKGWHSPSPGDEDGPCRGCHCCRRSQHGCGVRPRGCFGPPVQRLDSMMLEVFSNLKDCVSQVRAGTSLPSQAG